MDILQRLSVEHKQDIKEDSLVSATKRLMTDYYKDLFMNNPELMKSLFDSDKTYLDFKSYIEFRNGKRFRYGFLTVNPFGSVTILQLHYLMRRCVKKKCVQAAIWVYEWREKSQCLNKGLHAHCVLLLDKSYKPSSLRAQFRRTFKDVIGCKKHVHFWMSNDCYKHLNYINGEKGKPYDPKYDNERRKQQGMQKFYLWNNIAGVLTCPGSLEQFSKLSVTPQGHKKDEVPPINTLKDYYQ